MPQLRRWNPALEIDVNGIGRYERCCTQCHTWLPETPDNYSYGVARQRYNSWCRPCVRAYRQNATPGSRSTARRFGVEIEFHGSANALAAAMQRVGLICRVEGYNHRVSRTEWKIVPDGSVSNGAELVSPILQGEAGFAALAKAGEALAAAGCSVDRQTGLHVHHDVRNLTVSAFTRLVTNWAGCQSATDQLVAKSRRSEARNTYCAPLDEYEARMITRNLTSMARTTARHQLRGITRFKTLNVQSYGKYGTVEIRQHHGTIDAVKIAAWVRFGQAMIAAAVAGELLATTDGDALIDVLPLSASDQSYLHDRVRELAATTTVRRTTRRASASA